MTIIAILAILAATGCLIAFVLSKNNNARLIGKMEALKLQMMPEDQLKTGRERLNQDRKQHAQDVAKDQQRLGEKEKSIDAVIAQHRQHLEQEIARKRQQDLDAIAAIEEKSKQRRHRIEEDIAKYNKELASIIQDLELAQERQTLGELGFSRQEFTYEDPASYQKAIGEIEDAQAKMLKSDQAAKCNVEWKIEGSAKKGEQMIGKLMKLALRTFNADADAAIAKVKWNNFATMSDRIRKSEDTIEKTLDKWGIVIVDSYRDLKLKELKLTFEKTETDQRIRDEQRALREQQREEEKARREAENAEREAEREERRIVVALDKAKKEMSEAHTADMTKQIMRIKELEIQLATAGEQRQRAVSMAQLTRMGHVYIVSNIGSFGPEVLKIGMTRRMDPMDRIWELSDASVPFDFDVHAMIKTDDAPSLEAKLHEIFDQRRLNLINTRKEFFRVGIEEIQAVVTKQGLDVKLTLAAEARELRETEALRMTTMQHRPS